MLKCGEAKPGMNTEPPSGAWQVTVGGTGLSTGVSEEAFISTLVVIG